MEAFYCKLKDEKIADKFIGVAVDSQIIVQQGPAKADGSPPEFQPTILIGVVLKEITEDGNVVPCSQASPAYVPPSTIQFLGLVSEVDEDEMLLTHFGLSSVDEDDEETDLPSVNSESTSPVVNA